MKVHYCGATYLIHWRHVRDTYVTNFGEHVIKTKGGTTECTIYEGSGKSNRAEISHGQSTCSGLDNYNRAVGRKLSLARAIPKDTDVLFRKRVWETYLKECKA